MLRNYRSRRGPYAMAAPSPVPSIIRSVVLLGLVLLLLYFAGKWILWIFSGGAGQERTAVILQVEDRGMVNVSLEGGLMQRAEDTIKLFPEDKIATGGNGNARLTFFDKSLARVDVQSEVTIDKSALGEARSTWALALTQGALWLKTPSADSYSGSILRTITSPRYTATLPSDTEAVFEENGVIVFNADDEGVKLDIEGADEAITIGEGQQIELPEGKITGNALQWRSAIDPLAVQRTFVEESRLVKQSPVVTGSGSAIMEDETMLAVSAPADKTVVTAATVRVEGTVIKRVERVRVNGHDAIINRSDDTFTQELTLADVGDTVITVEALDARGIVLDSVTRTVTRSATAIEPPSITNPAKSGETYRTSKTEFAISGTAPAATAGIMVNEYKLQLFRTGDKTWSYLASTALNNLKPGANVYDVYALDSSGQKSQPVRITILLEEGSEGVIGSANSSAAAATSSKSSVSEAALPNNSPLMPGTITVTGPTAGNSHTATGSEFLIEGTTAKATASVWVNGYRLQLYSPGKTFWNYIAKVDYGTLKKGTNLYKITARNAKDEILDTFTYTVTYNP